jgi:hypothetical protein
MTILTIILIVLAIIVAIPLIIALFVNKKYTIGKEVVIDRPNADVFDYIKQIKNQRNYSVWVMADPNLKQEFTGIDGTIGFISYWNGNDKAGEGEQEITNIKEGSRVDVAIRFKRPFKSTATTYMAVEAINANSTRVIWQMSGKSSYPMNFMNLFMGSMLGKDMDKSLQNLKQILEKQH